MFRAAWISNSIDKLMCQFSLCTKEKRVDCRETHRVISFKMSHFPVHAGSTDEGKRLDVFLSRKLGYTRTRLCERYREGVLDERGRLLKWSHRISRGEKVLVPERDRSEPEIEVRYSILYRDQWLLAIDKGAGAVVHPVRGFRRNTVLTQLRNDLGSDDWELAHRLDRETSGVLIFGRTSPVLTDLMRQFSLGVSKRYLAIVRGNPAFDRKVVELPLCLDPHFPLRTRMMVDQQHGKVAVTEFEVLGRKRNCALIAAVPKTGRKHQIRVHLAAIGHPVLGDKLYQENGKPYLAMFHGTLDDSTLARIGHVRQALHAHQLEIAHPVTRERLQLIASLPKDMRDRWENGYGLDSRGTRSNPCSFNPASDSDSV
jgi:23S rRNA pseudouridine1911/1915/1917 synthase